MNCSVRFTKDLARRVCCLIVGGAIVGGAAISEAATITLQSLNSQVLIDPSSAAGMKDWVVDGTDYLTQESYWFRMPGGLVDSPLSALGLVSQSNTLTTADLYYAGGNLGVSVHYELTGYDPLSLHSKLVQQVTLAILGGTSYPTVQLFNYSNFDLCGSNDTVNMDNTQASQSGACSPVNAHTSVEENGTYEANTLPNTLNTFAAGGNLNNVGSATGDVTSAFQWGLYMTPPDSNPIFWDNGLPTNMARVTITQELAPVPEPMSMILLGTGLIAAARSARRRFGLSA